MQPTQEHLDIIAKRLPPGASINASQVEVLPFRVFDQCLTDRGTIMSDEMMKKLTLDLNHGKAAFNSLHQSRTTLPVGASINGAMKRVGGKNELHANMYAVIKNPDGSVAQDGADLANKFNTGAVRAVSAGVQVGFYCCNICGNDIRDWRNCEHIPLKTYVIDEKPKQCVATMTGHDIQDGMAMDCGIYEVSAVTAGGVANAGTLTEAFGRYADGADVSEFKKDACSEEKTFSEHILFEAVIGDPVPTNDNPRGDKDMMEKYAAEVTAHAQVKAEFNLLTTQHKTLETQYATLGEKLSAAETLLASKTTEFETKLAEATTALTTKETEYAAAVAEKDEAVAAKTAAEAFRAEYVDVVIGYGTMLGKEHKAEEFAGKTCDELKALYTEYRAEVAKLPTGQVSQSGDTERPAGEFGTVDVPASVYKF